jgi:carbamoyl-phosphate synthase large subunit
MKKPRLLFTGGGGAGTEALYHLLANQYEVYFADSDPDAKPYPIPHDRWVQIPFATAPNFATDVADLCSRLQIDLLLPTVDEELLPISRFSVKFDCEILLPPERFVLRHLDKLTSNQFLQNYGLPAPKTVSATDSRLDFPCVLKPRLGRGSRHVFTTYSEVELQAQIISARKEPHDFVLQELIIGDEFTVMMAADRNGILRAVVPVLVASKRGITIRAKTVHDNTVVAACQAIHDADPVSGCYNVQLIKTPAGQVIPFEINPRISTTACLGLAAGVNFVDIYINSMPVSTVDSSSLMDFIDCVNLKRSWHNEIFMQSRC